MRQYLLDTNICAFILRDKFGVGSHLLDVGIDNCHISMITYAELYYGAMNSNAIDKNLRQLQLFVDGIDVIPIDDVILDFAKEKVRLRRKGTPIDDFDLLIGTTNRKGLWYDFGNGKYQTFRKDRRTQYRKLGV